MKKLVKKHFAHKTLLAFYINEGCKQGACNGA